jgi:peptidoglycan hydrolase-like protein with peptidoglycan-binding domain
MNEGSRLGRRRRAVIGTAVAAALLSAGGMVGSGWVQSPSQAAADSRPPKASVLTAPVVRQVMRSTVVVRGTFSDGRTVSATPTAVAATAVSSQPATLMVTGVFTRPGRTVRAARALVEYSERPVFALPGALPMYRDLTFGEQGKDVAQLQAALRSLGHSTLPDTEGVFGTGTERAVTALYGALGYPVPVDAAADDSTVTTAEPAKPAAETAHAMVPSSEAVFVPALPARVVSVPVRVGDAVKGPVITLARGGMTLTGMLDPAQGGLVTPGLKAEVLSEATGAHAAGTVESVGTLVTPGDGKSGDTASSGGATSPYLPLTIRPAKSWSTRFAGQDVRITITAAATSGRVLAVPEAAMSSGADTRTTVTVVDGAGRQRTVQVEAGVSADGMVQVTPLHGGLAAGDDVVVGR